jgi:methanogenic corrinoid protein MtbC1
VGEHWKRGILTVAEEHRFTAFCESVFEMIASTAAAARSAYEDDPCRADVVLMNAPGNAHTLGLRFLALWFANKGVRARLVDTPANSRDLANLVNSIRPRFLLISMALAEQSAGVAAFAETVSRLPGPVRPRVIVGGYAVKLGFVSAIQGADLMADISQLEINDLGSGNQAF